jgi:hypothetical protein
MKKIINNHEILTCPRCDTINIHIWKRKPYKNKDTDSTVFFNFECRECGLKRSVKADSAYFHKLIETDKKEQAGYLIGLLDKQGNAFVSKWILDLFGDIDILEKWLSDETGLNVVLREANDPEIKAEGAMIAEVKS